jgi:outer membrane protein OmpA-like peptidoglycan-associated protein
MNKMKLATLGLCTAAVVSCGTNTGTGALIGAGGGALVGAIVGKLAGNTAVGAAIGTAVGTGAGALIGKHMDKVKAEAEAELNNATVEEVTDANGLKAVKITFDSGLLFNTSSAELSTASKTNLSNLAKLMKKYSTCAVDIYGHTDNQGWKNATQEESDNKNLALSKQRAQSVADYMTAQGVASSQLQNIVGKGSSEPVASNDTKEGMQQNRRVEIYLYASEEMVKEAQQGTLKVN